MTSKRTHIYILRHAQTLPTPRFENKDWTLSDKGLTQAEDLIEHLYPLGIDITITSPYERSKQTVLPFVRAHGCSILLDDRIIDQDTAKQYLPPSDFQELTRKMWNDPSFADQNCESNMACKDRIRDFMQQVVDEHPLKTVLVCTHGQPMALFLNFMDERFGVNDWANMNMPYLVHVIHEDNQFFWDKTFVSPNI